MRKRYTTSRLIIRMADPAFARMTAEFFSENRELFEKVRGKTDGGIFSSGVSGDLAGHSKRKSKKRRMVFLLPF